MEQKKEIIFTIDVNDRIKMEVDFAFSMYGFDFYLLEYDEGEFQIIEGSTGVCVSEKGSEFCFNCKSSAIDHAQKLLKDKGELETFKAIQKINTLIINELEKKK